MQMFERSGHFTVVIFTCLQWFQLEYYGALNHVHVEDWVVEAFSLEIYELH